MRVHLVNPSDSSFGIGVITPRWLYVLAAATPAKYGDPIITDETLEQLDLNKIQPGDIVGIGIHTGNALRGMQVADDAPEFLAGEGIKRPEGLIKHQQLGLVNERAAKVGTLLHAAR